MALLCENLEECVLGIGSLILTRVFSYSLFKYMASLAQFINTIYPVSLHFYLL